MSADSFPKVISLSSLLLALGTAFLGVCVFLACLNPGWALKSKALGGA